jgi:dTDP-4-dehydrorhamnose reductase
MSVPITSLVVGADGMIGRALSRRLQERGDPVMGTSRRPASGQIALDLSDDVACWQPPADPDVTYLCAAVTSIARCRTHPAEAYAVNVSATVELARALVRRGAFLVFPSTSAVFDGSTPCRDACSPTRPATEYGRQKAEAERRLRALSDDVCVVRFTKVLGPHTPLFELWAEELRNGRPIRPFVDAVVAPVPLEFAVEVLMRVGRGRLRGILQVSGPQDVTYEEIARHIARRVGVGGQFVQPVRVADSGLVFESVPRHTTLDTSRLRGELKMTPPAVAATIDSAFT